MKNLLKLFFSLLVLFSTIHASGETPTKDKVAKLYVATFNRAPDSAGLNYWLNDSHLDLEDIAKSFFDQNETKALYPSSVSSKDFINSVYQNLFNRAPDSSGLNYWEDKLNATNNYGDNSESSQISKNLFILAVINGAQDSNDGKDKTTLTNKTEVGLYFVDANLSDTDTAKEIMSNVSSDYDSVNQAFNEILQFSKATSKIISSLVNVGSAIAIEANDDTVFVGNYDGILYVIDVSDKLNPTILSQLDTGDIIEGMTLDSSDRLFLANNQKGLTIVDISNLSLPTIVQSIPSGYARAVDIQNSTIYVASGYAGIKTFDLTTYEKLAEIPVVGDFTDSIEVSSPYVFTSDSYEKNIVVTDMTTQKPVSNIKKDFAAYAPRKDINIKGNTMYVANGQSGLLIYDMSQIPDGSLISITPPSNDRVSYQVVVSSDETKAYVGTSGGVDIYDITNKFQPKITKTIDIDEGAAEKLILSNDEKYLYVAAKSKGLQIIELDSSLDSESTATTNFMDISKWDIYGTASLNDGTFIIGDNIGSDALDSDADKNYWNALADGSTQYDYDVIVSKESFIPPIDLKFSGTISTSDLGYNEAGFAYKDENFDATIAGGLPISTHVAEFVSRWEDSNLLDLYIEGNGYINLQDYGTTISAHNSYITGDFEIKWDGDIVTFYINNQEIYKKSVPYTQGKEVLVFFKNYERKFDFTNIYISASTVEKDTNTTVIEGTSWVNLEPDGEYSFSEAKAYCENLNYRLPTAQELLSVWNYYDATPSPEGFKKGTFYWGSKGEWCAMDYDCSNPTVGDLDGFGHPKCVVPSN